MKHTYRSIAASPEFHAAAYQMSEASFPEVAIIAAITDEQDFREYSEEEEFRVRDAIRTVVKRFF